MTIEATVLLNVLKVQPETQSELVALLKRNIETVISTLSGWRMTRLIAAKDGTSVVIYSEWDTAADVEAMRADPRMKAYFPQILALANFDSMLGETVFNHNRKEGGVTHG